MSTIPKTAADSLATRVFVQALKSLLMPVARLAIRLRIPCEIVVRTLRAAFVSAATTEGARGEKRASDVAIQAMTGLPRKSIAKIQTEETLEGQDPSPLAKVLGGWCVDPHYSRDGEPQELPLRALHTASFSTLVKRYAPDLAYRPVLDQLVEAGNVEITDYDSVRLVSTMYDPPKDVLNAMSAGLANVALHIETVVHNLTAPREERRTERKRLSRYIPIDIDRKTSDRLQVLLADTDAKIAAILDDAEVSPEEIELMTIGAGFYLFKSDVQ